MSKKVWVVSIDMGYGHQRTAYALKKIAESNEIITANNYKGIPEKDKSLWKQSRSFYEFISRFKNIPY
jgi:precorrin-3B methylase